MMEPMGPRYDVAYVGAGPFGITAACALKALNRNIRIVVIDKRLEPIRNHGLNTAADSVDFFAARINDIVKLNMTCSERESLLHLRDQFLFWRKKFIRTNDIENILGEFAKKIGITVLRNEAFDVKADRIEKLLDNSTEESRSELGQLLDARVVVAGDGAKSAIRNGLFGNKLADVQTLQYMIELKYQTDGKALPRDTTESVKMSSACGGIGIESMNRNPQDKDKPVTLHSFVKKEHYDSLRLNEGNGNIKGVFANPWTLDELKERSKNNPFAHEVYIQILRYLRDLRERDGVCKDARISTLDLTIYCSERAVREYKGHYILLGGDAYAGKVLERGWNSAIMEAILSSIAIHNFFQIRDRKLEGIPRPFQLYEEEIRKIYENEKWWALKKNLGISVINAVAGLWKQWVFEPVNTVYETSARMKEKAKEVTEDLYETSMFISAKISKHSSSKDS